MRPLQPSRAALCMAILISGSANLILAASSLYWKALEEIPPLTVLTYRIILSTAALSFFIFTPRKVNQIKNLTPRSILIHCAASLLVAVNWLTFISASINGNVLESGLGYLLAPFIAIVLGISIYRERITHTKILAISISFIAIVLLIAFSNTLNHWIYLLIATTWGSYTYLKKATPVDAVNGLFLETTFLTAGLALVIWLFDLPIILPGELSDRSSGLIWLAGLISIIPLLMFFFRHRKNALGPYRTYTVHPTYRPTNYWRAFQRTKNIDSIVNTYFHDGGYVNRRPCLRHENRRHFKFGTILNRF